MRHKLSFILFALCYFAASAQSFDGEFFADGKYWICEEYNMFLEESRQFIVTVGETVEEDGRIVKEIIRPENGDKPERFYGYGYEEDGKIYIKADVITLDDQFNLVLDFSRKTGDRVLRCEGIGYFPSLGSEAFEVLDEDQIKINGISRKIMTMYDDCTQSSFYWIYGVGTEDYSSCLIESEICLCAPNTDEEAYEDRFWYFKGMLECYQDDELIYSHDILEEYLVGKGGNLAGVGQVVASAPDDNQPLYDLMGRRVTTPQPGRIYVSPTGKRLFR